ncbi:MAG: hypothetical protein ACRC6B_06525, partial [Fusobacteriaceae bacterium]
MTFYLPLYSYRSGKVEARSGLNQGYADGRIRDLREVYIPIPRAFYTKIGTSPFPSPGQSFNLYLPNGDVLVASICQADQKALMSNPNSALGNWLVRDVLDIKHNRQITKEDLISAGIDSV